MKCPYCFENHPNSTEICPVTGQRINVAKRESDYKKTSDFLWLTVGFIGIVLVIFGISLLNNYPLVESISKLGDRINSIRIGAGSCSIVGNTFEPQNNNFPSSDSDESSGSQSSGQQISPTNTRVPPPTSTPRPTPTATPLPARPPANSMIAYALGDFDDAEIFIQYVNSGKLVKITNNRFEDKAPSFSPDNTKLVYHSNRNQGWQLYTYDLETGEEKRITNFAGQAKFPNWSPVPGDERIVFEGRKGVSGKFDINVWMVNSDGSDLKQLTFSNSDNRPIWTGDGSVIIFGRATKDSNQNGLVSSSDYLDIYTINPENDEIQQITNTDTVDEFQFGSSPDGTQIAFSAVSGDANRDGHINLNDARNIHFINIDGSNRTSLTFSNEEIYSPDYSPDGRFLSFNIWFNDNQSAIWIYDLATGEIIQLTERGPYYHPEWSH